jgi:hypothetical protein
MELNTSNKFKPKRLVLKESLPVANKQIVLKPLDKYVAKLRGKFIWPLSNHGTVIVRPDTKWLSHEFQQITPL